jgi:hypothetical protein
LKNFGNDMSEIDDIASEIKSGKTKDSGVVRTKRPNVMGLLMPNEKNEYEALRPPDGGLDQGVMKPRDDSYKGLKEVLGADKESKMKPMKKGGKVAGKLATRGYGKAR